MIFKDKYIIFTIQNYIRKSSKEIFIYICHLLLKKSITKIYKKIVAKCKVCKIWFWDVISLKRIQGLFFWQRDPMPIKMASRWEKEMLWGYKYEKQRTS